jgi:hypothetical protein
MLNQPHNSGGDCTNCHAKQGEAVVVSGVLLPRWGQVAKGAVAEVFRGAGAFGFHVVFVSLGWGWGLLNLIAFTGATETVVSSAVLAGQVIEGVKRSHKASKQGLGVVVWV